ncbi:triose-phosphate isomerase, partial [Patescibacteria group bacterium]|nr:triose-phosphate isomerase [Patescibacteria group bacterium]
MIIINFKLYKNTFGKGALKLAKICKKVMDESKIEVVLAVSPVDIYKIKKETGLKLYCQNIDEYEDGRWTGWI